MLKKILITLFIIPVIGAAIYGYFHFKQIKTPLSSVIKAIPSNAALILKCNTPKNSLQFFSMTNVVWKSLVTYPFFGELHTDIRYLDALFSNNSDALKSIQEKPLFISAHPDASNNFTLLFSINLPNTVTKKQVNDFIQNAAAKTAVYNLRIYDGVALNELKLNETKTLYYFFNKGIFSCTFSRFLIEDAIVQLNSGTPLSADTGFDKIWNSAGKKVEATLFINYNYFPQLFGNMIENKEAAFLKPFSTFANWTSLDIKVKNNSYQLSGFTFSKDSSNNYLGIFKDQEPQEIELADEIPANAAYFQCTALSDVNRYFKNYDTYLNNLTDHFNRQEALNNLNKKFGVNAVNFFKQWIGNQFAYVITEPESESYEQNCYAVFKTNSTKEVPQLLFDFKSKINSQQQADDTTLEQFRGYQLHCIKAESLLPLVFGEGFTKIKNSCFVLLDETVVFANSIPALKKWINIRLAKHTLSEDTDYKSFAENCASQSTLFIYSALGRSSKLFQSNFRKDVLDWNETKTQTLQNFHAVAFQLSANQSLYYSTLFAEYKPCYKKASESILDTELDTTVHSKPAILTDPSDSSRKILVQDDANRIYLIDNTGKIVWKRELKEKILSEIQSVRSRKENELQIVFSTKTKIYVLNKNGENVSKFPVVLSYLATNGVKAIDYEQNGEYRLLIAEENKRIYNYSLRGEPVNGWEAVVNTDKVYAPIKNFRAKGLDYLVILDRSGNVNLLDRKGKSVVKFKSKLKNAYRDNYTLAVESTLNASSLVACDSTGLVTRLYFSGKTEKSQVTKPAHEFYFEYLPSEQNFVFLSKNKLEIFDASYVKIAETKLTSSTLMQPCIIESTGNNYQLVVPNPLESFSVYSSEGIKITSINTTVTSQINACHFFGDASWYTVMGTGNKVSVFAGY